MTFFFVYILFALQPDVGIMPVSGNAHFLQSHCQQEQAQFNQKLLTFGVDPINVPSKCVKVPFTL